MTVSVAILFISICAGGAQIRPVLGIGIVNTGMSTTTSNGIENNLRKGSEIALKGSSIKPLWIDQGETTESTLRALNQINHEQPKILIGMGSSSQALLAGERLNSSVTLITPLATSDELKKYGQVLMISNSNDIQAKILAKEITSKSNLRSKILLIRVSGCPYCSNMTDRLSEILKNLKTKFDLTQIHISQFDNLPRNFINLKNYDHIILPVLEAEAARLIGEMRSRNPSATFWGGDGWGTLARYVRELPYSKSLKVFWLSHYYDGIQTPENVLFVENFRKAYGQSPVDTSAQYYESTRLALSLLKTINPSGEFKKLKGYRGLTGWVTIVNNHVVRPMPLLTLVDGQVRMQKLIVLGAKP